MDGLLLFLFHPHLSPKVIRIVIIIMLSPWNCTSVFPYCFIAPIIPSFYFLSLSSFFFMLPWSFWRLWAFVSCFCLDYLNVLHMCVLLLQRQKKLPRIPWRKKICLLSFMQFSCSGKVHYRKLWPVIWVPFRMTLHAETDCELSAAVYGKERKVSKKNRHYHHHHYCRHPSSHYGDRSTTDYYKYVWMRAEAGW